MSGFMTKGDVALKVKRVSHDGRTRWCPHCDFSFHMIRELVPITACPQCGAVWTEHDPSYVPPVSPPAPPVMAPLAPSSKSSLTKPRATTPTTRRTSKK